MQYMAKKGTKTQRQPATGYSPFGCEELLFFSTPNDKVQGGGTRVATRACGQKGVLKMRAVCHNKNRRHICPNPSNLSSQSVFLQWLQLVAARKKKKLFTSKSQLLKSQQCLSTKNSFGQGFSLAQSGGLRASLPKMLPKYGHLALNLRFPLISPMNLARASFMVAPNQAQRGAIC